MTLQPGEIILNGKYRVERLLGRGAFGEVYLVTHQALQVPRALKVLRSEAPGLGSTKFADYRGRFALEAALGAQVDNLGLARVVRVYDFEAFSDQLFLVMEYLPGQSIKDLLAQEGALPWKKAVAILQDAAHGLAELYDRLKVIHRDVKPSNILLDEAGRAKIADLGLAQTPEDLSSRDMLGSQSPPHPGTPGYRSPEHDNPNPLAPTADVYGLGCVAFEMLTGEPWYQVRHRAERVVDLAPQTPMWLDEVVARMLREEGGVRAADANNPAKRFVGLEPVIAALEQGLRDEKERVQLAAQQQQAQAAAEHEREIAAAARRRALPWMLLAGFALLAALLVVWRPWEDDVRPTPVGVTNAPVATTTTPTDPVGNRGATEIALVDTPTATPRLLTAPPTTTPLPPTAPPTATMRPLTETLTASPTLGIGSTWTSPVDGMVQVYVPAGEFLMGSADSDGAAAGAEKPQHMVTLAAYRIDRTEVTNAMFAGFVAATGHETDAEKAGSSWVYDTTSKEWKAVSGADWQHPRGPGSDLVGQDQHPVVQVSWQDAAAYCAWAGRRLPSEAEWEKAARGTDGQIYPWGNQGVAGELLNFADRNLDVSWADKNVDDGYQFTAPVGSYPKGASPYGALDMAGNVWEWVADWYDEKYYANSPAQNPVGPDAGEYRVLRGGSWNGAQRGVRAAGRYRLEPELGAGYIGFRCARS